MLFISIAKLSLLHNEKERENASSYCPINRRRLVRGVHVDRIQE